MTFRRIRIRHAAVVAAIAGAVAAPAALAGNETVQIGGRLVEPSQVSAVQTELGSPASARLVQIDGRLVRPERISRVQSASGPRDVQRRESNSQLTWRDTALVFSIAAALLLGMTVLAMRRRAVSLA